jgi:hypothetical protein
MPLHRGVVDTWRGMIMSLKRASDNDVKLLYRSVFDAWHGVVDIGHQKSWSKSCVQQNWVGVG